MKDKIFKELAEKYGLDVKEVEKACRSQFKFTRSIMEKGDHESVRLQYLGLFRVRPSKKNKVKIKKDE